MNVALGRTGILLALLAALVGAATLGLGLWKGNNSLLRAGRTYSVLVLLGAIAATVAMEHALFTHDFRIAYIAENNSRETPLLYDATGMWSALAGSILLWGLVLSGYLAAMVFRFRARVFDPLVAWATLVVYLVAAFFFGLMAGPANPFALTKGPIPLDGAGPDPLLQARALVAVHPPMLYLGFVGFTVPFAFAIASLVTGRIGEGWLIETRRWALFAWGFLSLGIVMGAWWSYQVLGWGGFWAWDPVENAAFLPWLCGTAYLHSVMVQERRGLLRVWNLALLIATFALTLLGTFLTRSGAIQSVHAFSNSRLGPLLIGFFALVVVSGVILIGWRGEQLRTGGGVESLRSREGAILANNVAFAAFAFMVLAGTVFPLFVQYFQGAQVDVGAPYFNTVTAPVALTLLFLMAVAPALPWRRARAEVVGPRLIWPAWAGAAAMAACVLAGIRGLQPLVAFGLAAFAAASALRSILQGMAASARAGERRWRALLGREGGGMVVHIGVVTIAAAFAAASSFGHRGQVVVAPGQTVSIAGHRLTYIRTITAISPAKTSIEALVRVDGSGIIRPAISRFGAATTYIGSPAVRSGPAQDVYLTLDHAPATPRAPATIGVVVQPLVAWLWVGGGIVGLGVALASVPRKRARRRPRPPFERSASTGTLEPPPSDVPAPVALMARVFRPGAGG